jgi:two-component system, response regulator, stage 0 sporulation protein F
MIALMKSKKFYLNLILLFILSPVVIFSIIIYGFIFGSIGAIVWCIEKFQLLDFPKTTNLFLIFTYFFFKIYFFLLICTIAFFVGLLFGPLKSFIVFKKKLLLFLQEKINNKQTYKGNKKLVLVVDDEKELAQLVSEEIKGLGEYDTILAHNGKEALDRVEDNERFLGIAKNKIGCIILDIKMPVMNGLEFLQELRKREGAIILGSGVSFNNIPVIILSAYEDIEKITHATDPNLGKALNYIVKPENIEGFNLLINTIKAVFLGKENYLMNKTLINSSFRLKELSRIGRLDD